MLNWWKVVVVKIVLRNWLCCLVNFMNWCCWIVCWFLVCWWKVCLLLLIICLCWWFLFICCCVFLSRCLIGLIVRRLRICRWCCFLIWWIVVVICMCKCWLSVWCWWKMVLRFGFFILFMWNRWVIIVCWWVSLFFICWLFKCFVFFGLRYLVVLSCKY